MVEKNQEAALMGVQPKDLARAAKLCFDKVDPHFGAISALLGNEQVFEEVARTLRQMKDGNDPVEEKKAVTVGRQHVAKAVAHRERFVESEEGPADTRGAPDVFHIVSMQQRLRLVDEKMRAMPEALSSTFEAYIEEGLTYEQAAKSLSIPIGTVRSRIFRVRELVQGC